MKVRIEGDWPGPVSLQRGWWRAAARPWNDATPMAHLRVERGGAGFLDECASALLALRGVTGVLSPPLLAAARPPVGRGRASAPTPVSCSCAANWTASRPPSTPWRRGTCATWTRP